nr:uncharacterized protein LOC109739876 isoform X2 [Aegilops tauschii subsp. strangulata]
MAGGSGAEEGHCREEFHRQKDGVACVRRAGAVEAGSPLMLSSSSCHRPASLGSPVLTSTSPRCLPRVLHPPQRRPLPDAAGTDAPPSSVARAQAGAILMRLFSTASSTIAHMVRRHFFGLNHWDF